MLLVLPRPLFALSFPLFLFSSFIFSFVAHLLPRLLPQTKQLQESVDRLKLQMKQTLKAVEVFKSSGPTVGTRKASVRNNGTADKKLRQRNTELEARNRNLSNLLEEVNDQHRNVIHKVWWQERKYAASYREPRLRQPRAENLSRCHAPIYRRWKRSTASSSRESRKRTERR